MFDTIVMLVSLYIYYIIIPLGIVGMALVVWALIEDALPEITSMNEQTQVVCAAFVFIGLGLLALVIGILYELSTLFL